MHTSIADHCLVDARLDLPTIPPAVLSGIVELGVRAGCDIGSWFAGTGLTVSELLTEDSIKVSFRQAVTVLRRAVAVMPDRPLGMQVGGRDILLSMGMLGVAMRSAATVGEALSIGLELHQASGSLMDIDLEQDGGTAALRLYERQPEPLLLAFLCEEVLCSTTVFVRSVVGADWTPARLELGYEPPSYASRYQSFFRCPVEFRAEYTRMVFPAATLNLPFATRNQPTRAIAVDACRRLIDTGRGEPDVVAVVEALLEQHLRHPLTMAEVAARLHVTERTLRRRLSAADESFSSVRDRVRRRRATALLRESTMPVAAVAHQVGYSDIREFRRAYVRWTGQPPSATRR
ncbi:AraC family transcriptional regulator [Nocardia sp. 2]|uniref:AraC family transcriptional regulator n=1 Tax=Nocardia acididurans TaxID=2802282 RepID=A0ABS1MHR6_9NOCA|nr:AraC family transcriptional regulator [Nocardia acididurans]MBL1080206.1 AraC family transcriptional regulator [Nocardia acididurans]